MWKRIVEKKMLHLLFLSICRFVNILMEGHVLESSNCCCAIEKSDTRSYVNGVLYTLAHMKASNLKSLPSNILKDFLP